MKEINVVADHRGLQGSFLNLIDFQQYLTDVEGYYVTFHCNEVHELKSVVNRTFRNYSFHNPIKIRDMIISTKQTVVTDFKTLVSMYKDKKRIIANKMIVFDNLELSLFLNDMRDGYFYPDIIMDELLDWHKHSEIIFLMPRSNKEVFEKKYPDLTSYEFYKKLYVPKVDNIPIGSNGKLFYRINNFYDIPTIQEKDISVDVKRSYPNAVGLSIKQGHEVFEYDGYIYTKKQETNYCEQFGRMIFEFLIMGKEVHWFDEPLEYNDGLRDYILHYSDDGGVIREMMLEPYKDKYWE